MVLGLNVEPLPIVGGLRELLQHDEKIIRFDLAT
jgi:hypothetical protein